jgi:hypothetical protein
MKPVERQKSQGIKKIIIFEPILAEEGYLK